MGKNTQSLKIVREFSSGGVVYKPSGADKKVGNSVLWCVRQTVASELFPNQYWMLPKGRIDDTEDDEPGPMASGKIKADEKSLRAAALKEVSEEAGVEAKITKKIGTTIYSFTDPKKGKVLKFATFYVMEWQKDLPDGHDDETSEVLWLPFEEAYKKLSFGGEKQMLKKAKNLLAPVA